MQNDRPISGRISYRLPGFDYAAPGSFFVTICTDQRRCLFGDVIDGVMHRNTFGEIVHQEWLRTPIIRPEIDLDEFIVMPNHLHGIIHIIEKRDAGLVPNEPAGAHRRAPTNQRDAADATGAPVWVHVGASADCRPVDAAMGAHIGAPLRRHAGTLGSIIAGFKSTVTLQVNTIRMTPRQPVWQPRFHERVIRTEQSLQRIRTYIRNNPMQWHLDKQNSKYGL